MVCYIVRSYCRCRPASTLHRGRIGMGAFAASVQCRCSAKSGDPRGVRTTTMAPGGAIADRPRLGSQPRSCSIRAIDPDLGHLADDTPSRHAPLWHLSEAKQRDRLVCPAIFISWTARGTPCRISQFQQHRFLIRLIPWGTYMGRAWGSVRFDVTSSQNRSIRHPIGSRVSIPRRTSLKQLDRGVV